MSSPSNFVLTDYRGTSYGPEARTLVVGAMTLLSAFGSRCVKISEDSDFSQDKQLNKKGLTGRQKFTLHKDGGGGGNDGIGSAPIGKKIKFHCREQGHTWVGRA
jgi:hypothetical protein